MGKRTKALLIMLCCTFILLPQIGFAAEKVAQANSKEPMDNLVVILSTNDIAYADAAINIAKVAFERGHKVTMLLRVKALSLALKDANDRIGDTTFQEKLASFMKQGARVMVGGQCMKQQGIPKNNLIPGVEVGTAETVMDSIFEKNTRIICQ
ncbi:MAG: DsrE family protein [Desulfobulbus sp.]